MFYHYLISWGETYWVSGHDLTEDIVIQDVVLPFIGKQIRLFNLRGTDQLLNLGNCTRLAISKTENKLTEEEIKELENRRAVY